MKLYKDSEQLCFDDILLVPQNSDVSSRKDVRLNTSIGNGNRGIGLKVPVIAAPMDTVCEYELAVATRKNGGLGIIHRYNTLEERIRQVKMVKAHDRAICGVAVGATGEFLSEAWQLAFAGASVILIDTANGHSEYAIEAVKKIRRTLSNSVHIMAGNVSTYEGFARLQDAGADSIRVGIGGGSVCTTRIVSGHGMPTLASIMDIRERINYSDGASIIADGGIRNSGDAAKALAAGANAVMVGSMLAGTDESPGNLIDGYKSFRGMASKEAQEDGRGIVSVVEGIKTSVPYRGSVKDVLDELSGGLGSALSYSGAHNLEQFHKESEFIKVTYSSLGESKPHAKRN
jgi:IMP dehydrogenase